MALLLSATLLCAFLLTLVLVPVARAWARRAGMVDEPGGRKAHAAPVPLGGGLAVAAAALLTLGGGVALAWAVHSGRIALPLPPDARVHLPGAVEQAPRLLLILGGGLAIAALGLVDDLRDLAPRWKLLGQCTVAAALVLFGDIRLSVFSEGAGAAGRAASFAATLAWIAAVTNAFNLLDHMDGICAGVAAVCGAAFFAVAVQTGQFFIAALLGVAVGAGAGFLVYNFPPASIFLGDAGSQFLGYLLAVATVLFTFYEPPYPLFSYFVPAVVLAVPIYDMIRVVGIRLAAGRSPFEADLHHLSHRLVGLGLSARRAAGLIYLLAAVCGLSAMLLYEATPVTAGVVFAHVVLLLGLVGVLESRMRRRSAAGRRDSINSKIQ